MSADKLQSAVEVVNSEGDFILTLKKPEGDQKLYCGADVSAAGEKIIKCFEMPEGEKDV